VSLTTMTFLFTDIEGSTRQWETTPKMHQRVQRHFDILSDAVAACGGQLFSTTGDGIVAAFTSAESAVRAAIEAQRRLPASGLKVRMGLHTGEARRVADDYRGQALNRAARIMAVGHGDQILVSAVTAALVRSGPAPAALVDLGVRRLRDLAEPEHVWQVAAPGLARSFPPLRGLDTFSKSGAQRLVRSAGRAFRRSLETGGGTRVLRSVRLNRCRASERALRRPVLVFADEAVRLLMG
jgi:class 3 adenylate cyclase